MFEINDWLETFLGREFWLTEASINTYDYPIEEIAHTLSLICRFNGQCMFHYSVAQHSVLVSHMVPIEHRMLGLLHDASEAYLTDIPRPIKARLKEYKELESLVESAINRIYFGEKYINGTPTCVKHFDTIALMTEAKYIMKSGGKTWYRDGLSADGSIGPISEMLPQEAEKIFLERYYELLRSEV